MKTLVINSYAGSITLGARALGCEVIGSYEDHNFGLGIQQHNMPGLNYVAYREEWPEQQDLSETIVIAHPPCSAFSVQNCSPTARGINSNAFACTKVVLDYAMQNRALAVCIESVMGALGGAWPIHQHYADAHEYHLYRILENGCMWGAQWRERFWVVYIRKGAAPEALPLTLTPRWQTVGEVIEGHEDGPAAGNQDVLLADQKRRLREEAKLTDEEMSFFFDTQEPPHPTIALGTLLWEKKFKRPDSKPGDRWEVFKQYIGGFASGTMVYLDPHGFSPVLMGGSFWYINGRCLSENGFKRIMGFPADYEFPSSPRNWKSQIRMYLSKGVMPPIAEWVLEQVTLHLGWHGQARLSVDPAITPYHLEVMPNHIADFRIRKDDWWQRDVRTPPLKCEEDRLELYSGSSAYPEPWKSAPPPRPRRTQRERPVRTYVASGRLGHQRIAFTTCDGLDGGLTGARRRLICNVVESLGRPTLDEAVAACVAHPSIPILPTTTRWHIRQLCKTGQLQEVNE